MPAATGRAANLMPKGGDREKTMNAFAYTASQRRNLAATAIEGSALAAQRIVARIRVILRGMRDGHESRAAVRQLQSLNDQQLKDIGISRCQIWYLAHGTSASLTRNGHAED
jgi:uncharacterized protein YjiS (DUF1127 family)